MGLAWDKLEGFPGRATSYKGEFLSVDGIKRGTALAEVHEKDPFLVTTEVGLAERGCRKENQFSSSSSSSSFSSLPSVPSICLSLPLCLPLPLQIFSECCYMLGTWMGMNRTDRSLHMGV